MTERQPSENSRSLRRRAWLLTLAAGVGLAASYPALTLSVRYRHQIYRSPEEIPQRAVAVVFGAGYWADGRPSDVMWDRVTSAAELYQEERVHKLLLSGDNRRADYNEPAKMREIALSLGIPDEDIVLDYAGRRTYDTCYRARAIFGLEEAVLVTQRYHLPRALYLCEGMGIEAVGYAADRQPYVRILAYWAREIPALWLSWWDLRIRHPVPILGSPIPILEEDNGTNP